MYLHVGYVHISVVPAESEEGLGFPRSRVTSGCEMPVVGAGNQTQVHYKSSKYT